MNNTKKIRIYERCVLAFCSNVGDCGTGVASVLTFLNVNVMFGFTTFLNLRSLLLELCFAAAQPDDCVVGDVGSSGNPGDGKDLLATLGKLGVLGEITLDKEEEFGGLAGAAGNGNELQLEERFFSIGFGIDGGDGVRFWVGSVGNGEGV